MTKGFPLQPLTRRRKKVFLLKNKLYSLWKKNAIDLACKTINGFEEFRFRFKSRIALAGLTQSTHYNYLYSLAKLALHFERIPTDIDPEQVNDYLYLLTQTRNCPSQSFFKFTVYGLRFAYRLEKMPERLIRLPKIKRESRLPIVLSRNEIKRLIETPKLLKHRVAIALLYGCGLRNHELRSLKVADLDFDRRMLHVRKGKRSKDRYVPLSIVLIEMLQEYIKKERPNNWLFYGRIAKPAASHQFCKYSQRGLQWVIRHHAANVQIEKPISPHMLRHTFATHLIEDGLDIVTLKELLGHVRIETTMVYLHVAQFDKSRAFSPLDTLYGVAEKRNRAVACPILLREFEGERWNKEKPVKASGS